MAIAVCELIVMMMMMWPRSAVFVPAERRATVPAGVAAVGLAPSIVSAVVRAADSVPGWVSPSGVARSWSIVAAPLVLLMLRGRLLRGGRWVDARRG
jgi:hypothetical protein